MDQELDTTEEGAIEEAMATVPDEVLEFMASPLYGAIVTAIKEVLLLTPEQQALVLSVSQRMLIFRMSMEDALKYLADNGISEETGIKILYLIDREILTRAESITEFFTDDSDPTENEIATYKITAPVPANTSLTSIAQRLKNTSSTSTGPYPAQKGIVPENLPITESRIEPIMETQPVDDIATVQEPVIAPPPAPPTPLTKSFDPYHEPIDR